VRRWVVGRGAVRGRWELSRVHISIMDALDDRAEDAVDPSAEVLRMPFAGVEFPCVPPDILMCATRRRLSGSRVSRVMPLARSRGRATRSRAGRPTRRTHPPYAPVRRPPLRASAARWRRIVRRCRSHLPPPYGGGHTRALGAVVRAAVLSSRLSRRKRILIWGRWIRRGGLRFGRRGDESPAAILPPAYWSVKAFVRHPA
jgi:hypothetical protein